MSDDKRRELTTTLARWANDGVIFEDRRVRVNGGYIEQAIAEAGLALARVAFPNLDQSDLVAVPREFISSGGARTVVNQIRADQRAKDAAAVLALKASPINAAFNKALEAAAQAIKDQADE